METGSEAEFNKAIQLIQLGRFDMAEKHLLRCLAADPENADALAHLAMLYNLKNNTAVAEDFIKQSIGFDPENYYAFYIYSKILYAKENYKGALQMIDECLNYYPEFVSGHTYKGLILYNTGYFDKALSCFNDALNLDATDSEALSLKSKCLRALGKKEEAYHLSEEGVRQNIESESAWIQKGIMQIESRHYKLAKESFENAIRLNPENVIAKELLLKVKKLLNGFLRNFESKTNQKLLLTQNSYWFIIIPHFWFGILFRALLLQFCDYVSHAADLFYSFNSYNRNLFSSLRKKSVMVFSVTHAIFILLIAAYVITHLKITIAAIYLVLFFNILFFSYADDAESEYSKIVIYIFAIITIFLLAALFISKQAGAIFTLTLFAHTIFTMLFYLKVKVLGLNRTFIEK